MSNKRKQDSSSQEEITTTEILKRRRVEDDSSNRLPNFYFSAAANILENNNLWEHQKQAYKKVHDYLCKNSSTGNLLLVVLPTGTGKSGIAHILPFGLKGRVLMITHNTDSCYQLVQNENFLYQRQVLHEGAAAPKVHIVQNQVDMIHLQENYSQYDLFIANIHKFDLGGKWKNTIGQFFQFIIIDEGHHIPAKIYNNVVMNQLLTNSTINIILLTATPKRRDRLSLNAKIIYEYSMKQAVEQNLIKHPCLLTYEPETITIHEDGRTAQYQIRKAFTYQLKRKLYKAMFSSKEVRSQLLIMMIKLIEEKRRETQTFHQAIIVCASQKDCDRVTMELNNDYAICGQPVAALSYHSELSTPQRLHVQQELKNKRCDVVVHCGLMNEGHDCPTISITLVLCKIKWIGRFSQVVGRSIRYLQGKSLIDNTSHIIMNYYFVGKIWESYKGEAVTTTKLPAAQENVTSQNSQQKTIINSVLQKQREVRMGSCQDTYTNDISGLINEESTSIELAQPSTTTKSVDNVEIITKYWKYDSLLNTTATGKEVVASTERIISRRHSTNVIDSSVNNCSSFAQKRVAAAMGTHERSKKTTPEEEITVMICEHKDKVFGPSCSRCEYLPNQEKTCQHETDILLIHCRTCNALNKVPLY